MIIKNANLEKVCGITSEMYVSGKPEFAFAGKSNVGKSSLINVLMQRKKLARTSSEPGKTQTINYYFINEQFYLVDLPGYGYAKASKETVAKWGRMIEDYLSCSKDLKAVFLLVDIRHEPSDNDRMMYDWICGAGFTPIVIATKKDKIKRSQLSKQLSIIRKGLGADSKVTVIPFSSTEKSGREEIIEILDSYLEQ